MRNKVLGHASIRETDHKLVSISCKHWAKSELTFANKGLIQAGTMQQDKGKLATALASDQSHTGPDQSTRTNIATNKKSRSHTTRRSSIHNVGKLQLASIMQDTDIKEW